MKKVIALLLALVLSLSLCACKSQEVKDVEVAIEAIGDVTLDSQETIANARDLYEDLSGDDQDKVENYNVLKDAEDDYEELARADMLDAIADLGEAVEKADVPGCLAVLAHIEEMLPKLTPELREEMDELVGGVYAGHDLEAMITMVREYTELIVIHNTTIAVPGYVVTPAHENTYLVNDHGDFAAYNTIFWNKYDAEEAFEEYKAYISQYATISEDTGDTFVATDDSGNVITVILTQSSKYSNVQVRVPRF